MAQSGIPSPRSGRELLEEYFVENRYRVLDVAAFLDRIDRGDPEGREDFRMRAFREALEVLRDGSESRVDRIQMIFSDPTGEPRAELDQKAAKGAFDPEQQAGR
jgi:hypothetical protein